VTLYLIAIQFLLSGFVIEYSFGRDRGRKDSKVKAESPTTGGPA
jgi:hypothetical protein